MLNGKQLTIICRRQSDSRLLSVNKKQNKVKVTPQGKVPQRDDNSLGRLLWTRVSRIFLLCRKETKGLLEEMEDVSGSFFKM